MHNPLEMKAKKKKIDKKKDDFQNDISTKTIEIDSQNYEGDFLINKNEQRTDKGDKMLDEDFNSPKLKNFDEVRQKERRYSEGDINGEDYWRDEPENRH